MNCREFKKCGREKGGKREKELGVCPACSDHGTDCAGVTGTLCGSQVQEPFAMKVGGCMQCDFYTSPYCKKGAGAG